MMAAHHPYSVALQNPTLLASVTAGISLQKSHQYKQARSWYSRGGVPDNFRDIGSVIDGITFLLRSHDDCPKGAKIAASLVQLSDSIGIYWTTTESSADADQRLGSYMAGVLTIFAKGLPSESWLLSHLLEEGGRRKIMSRCSKIAQAFAACPLEVLQSAGKVSPLGREDDTTYVAVEQKLRSRGVLRTSMSLQTGMENFIGKVAKVDEKTDTGKLMPIIGFAYGLVFERVTMQDYVSDAQFRSIEKLGQYLKTVKAFRNRWWRLRQSYKGQIFAQQVRYFSFVSFLILLSVLCVINDLLRFV